MSKLTQRNPSPFVRDKKVLIIVAFCLLRYMIADRRATRHPFTKLERMEEEMNKFHNIGDIKYFIELNIRSVVNISIKSHPLLSRLCVLIRCNRDLSLSRWVIDGKVLSCSCNSILEAKSFAIPLIPLLRSPFPFFPCITRRYPLISPLKVLMGLECCFNDQHCQEKV